MAVNTARLDQSLRHLTPFDPAPGVVPPTRLEHAALTRRARRGDTASRDALAIRHRRLVLSIARRYIGFGMEFEDLTQEGMTGLLKAIDRFDPARNVAFSTYATFWIRQAIHTALARTARPIRLPAHLAPVGRTIRQALERLPAALGRMPTAGEIAGEARTDPGTCTAVLRTMSAPLSLSTSPTGGDRPLEEVLADEVVDGPAEQVMADFQRDQVHALLEILSPRERDIIRARFGFDGPVVTGERLARAYGVTPARIRQIEGRALERLRAAAKLCPDLAGVDT